MQQALRRSTYASFWDKLYICPGPRKILKIVGAYKQYLTLFWWLILAPAASNIVTTSLQPLSDDMTSGVSPPSYTWQREKTWSYISSPVYTCEVITVQRQQQKGQGGNSPIFSRGASPQINKSYYNRMLCLQSMHFKMYYCYVIYV